MQPGEGATRENVMRWHTYSPISTTDPSAILFKSDARNYIVTVKERTAFLSTLDKEGKLVWHGRLLGPIPSDVAGGAWSLKESYDHKQVALSWIANGKRATFRFDAVTGKLLANDSGLSPGEKEDASRLATFRARLAAVGYFKNQSPPGPDPVKKVQRSITFATGENRIYILGIENSAERPCFLSAQTNQAHQVWRSTFFNPLLTKRWARSWRESFSGPLPSSGLAGNWMVEESDDQTQVVVTWKGNRVLIRIRFDIATGKLQQEDFMPPALVRQALVQQRWIAGKSGALVHSDDDKGFERRRSACEAE